MMEEVLSLMLIVLEITGLNLFAAGFLESGWKNRKSYVLLAAVESLCMYGLLTLLDAANFNLLTGLKFFLELLVFSLYIALGYRGSLWKQVFCAAVYLTFLSIVDSLGLFLIHAWNEDILLDFSGMSLVYLLCKALECLAAFLVNRICASRKYHYQLSGRTWVQFLWFPVMTLVIMSVFLVEGDWQRKSVPVISMVLLLANIWLFYLLYVMSERESEHRQLLLQQEASKRQAELYESLQNSYFEQRARAHDFQLCLERIEALLRQGRTVEAAAYAQAVNEKIEHQRKYYNTSNALINALVNEKSRQAKKGGIVLSFRIADLSQLSIGEEDLVRIFTFLLDGTCVVCESLGCPFASVFMEREEGWQILVNIPARDGSFDAKARQLWEEQMADAAMEELLNRLGGELFCYGSGEALICQVTF